MNLRAQTAIGAMSLIANGTATADFVSFGLTPEDFDSLSGDGVWVGADRPRIERILKVLIHGTMDAVGVDRFNVSAEYVSAVISVFVAPANIMTACAWCSGHYANDDISAGVNEQRSRPVKAATLFALCLELQSADPSSYLAKYRHRHGLAEPVSAEPQ